MESTAITAGWQSHRLQQMRTNPKEATINTKTKEEKITYLQEASSRQGSPAKKNSCLHCQPLNEVWEGVDLSPPLLVTQVHYMHLSSSGLALSSHQVFNHCFKLRLCISTTLYHVQIRITFLTQGISIIFVRCNVAYNDLLLPVSLKFTDPATGYFSYSALLILKASPIQATVFTAWDYRSVGSGFYHLFFKNSCRPGFLIASQDLCFYAWSQSKQQRIFRSAWASFCHIQFQLCKQPVPCRQKHVSYCKSIHLTAASITRVPCIIKANSLSELLKMT